MFRKTHLGWFLVGATLAGCSAGGPLAVTARAEEGTPESDLGLTVYKNDFALVHDVRSITLSHGSSDTRLPRVSKMLDPESVLFDWPGAGSKPEVVSTTYNLGVGSSDEALKRLVGQNVDIVWRGQDGKVGDRASGTLEEAGQGTVLHTKDSYLINPGGEIVADGGKSMPTMPQLDATVDSKDAGDRKVGVSYLTRGLSWSADYVGVISPDAKTMRLECWGTITNLTGTDFPHAKLKLIAGNPNRAVLNSVPVAGRIIDNDRSDSTLEAPMAAHLAKMTPTGELYAYDLPAKANVMQQQMNRARVFASEAVPIKRTYAVNLNGGDSQGGRKNAQVEIAFTNEAHSQLGIPLPSGTLRAYEQSDSGQTYTGAADLGDTPKGERVSLTLSDAFDVFVKVTQSNRKRLNKHTVSETYSVNIYNEKLHPVDVRIADSFGMAATIVSESVKSSKTAFDSFEWHQSTPASSTKTLTFTVLLKG